ncbi:MAG: hypothetical protein MJ141_04820 [Clostridia bacterium]|nr:hypothetical protein [Clostridia bacterium]
MKNKSFPIGFWNYPAVGAYGPEEVSRWTRCGMTWNQSPRFSYETNTKEELLAILDECEKQGIGLTLCISGLDYRDALRDIDAYRALFERAYADFGHHPATVGFFIGDEPIGEAENKACIEAYKIMLSTAPELTPLLNFNPYFPGFEDAILGGQDFTSWARDFTAASGCKLICYDCYTQLNEGEEGVNSYFLNLNKYSEMARGAGIEIWTTLLCSAHYLYRAASEDDIRWQLSTAVASGCRGILWFLFYDSIPNNNYRSSPIDPFGEETETYHYIRRVQKVFHAMYGELMMKLSWKKTWHFEKAYGDYPLFPENEHPFIKRMISEQGLPGILSLFEDEDGKEYAVMVNNSPFKPGRFAFALPKDTKKIWRIQKNGDMTVDFKVSHHDAIYQEKDDEIIAGCFLAPGQMEVFRFE